MESGTGTHSDYSQQDPRWANVEVGFATKEPMKLYGCFVDAMANVASAQGQQMTPLDVNNALKTHGLFVRDNLGQIADIAGYYALGAITPHSHYVEQKNWPGSVIAPVEYFDVGASVNTEIIVEIDYHPEEAGLQTHFCRVIGTNAAKNDVEIVDSYTGQRVWLSSIAAKGGKKAAQIILSAGKYTKV